MLLAGVGIAEVIWARPTRARANAVSVNVGTIFEIDRRVYPRVPRASVSSSLLRALDGAYR
jgi:hypothetical protein